MGTTIETLEKPKGPIDRSMGDVHPEGNPHYYLSLPELAHAADKMFVHFAAGLNEANLAKVEGKLRSAQNQTREKAY